MQISNRLIWALGTLFVLLAFAFITQGVLLWQTRQELAELRGEEDPVPNSIEERLLARLDAQQQSRSPVVRPDPNSGASPGSQNGLFSSPLAGSLFNPFSGASSDPFTRMEQLRQQMNSVFGSGFGGSFGSPGGFAGMRPGLQSPEIALEETPDDFRVRIQVPEQHEVDLQTEVEDQQITVYGTVTARIDDQQGNARSSMVSSSRFSRRFDLPDAIDELAVHTTQDENGLVVMIPKQARSA